MDRHPPGTRRTTPDSSSRERTPPPRIRKPAPHPTPSRRRIPRPPQSHQARRDRPSQGSRTEDPRHPPARPASRLAPHHPRPRTPKGPHMSNHVTITGNLGSDPELRFIPSGKAVATISVGDTPRRFNKDTNQWEDAGDTLWLRCSIW